MTPPTPECTDLTETTHQLGAQLVQVTDHTYQSGAQLLQVTDHTHQSGEQLLQVTDLTHQSGAQLVQVTDHTHQSGAHLQHVTDQTYQSGHSLIFTPGLTLPRPSDVDPTGPTYASRAELVQVTDHTNHLVKQPMCSYNQTGKHLHTKRHTSLDDSKRPNYSNIRKSGWTKTVSKNHRDTLQLTVSMAVIFGVFLLCGIPYVIVNLFERLMNQSTVHFWSILLSILYGMLNPLIYAAMNHHFRAAYRTLFSACHLKCINAKVAGVPTNTS